MNYEELRQDLARLLSLPALENDPFVMAQAEHSLNLANTDVALALRTPSVTQVMAPDPQGVISWPNNAFAGRDGLQYIIAKNSNESLRLFILSEIEAYTRFPRWETMQGSPHLVIFDPSSTASGIRIVPYDSNAGFTYHVRYVKMPGRMDSPADLPLDGELPQYHFLVSLRAALLMLEYDYAGGETADYIGFTNIRKYEALNKQYQLRLVEAQRAVLPQTTLVRNPLWHIE